MTKLIFAAALPAILLGASAAHAQAQKLNPAVIAIVDKDKVYAECTACKAAQTQLQTQAQQIQQRATALQTSLQPEAQALEAAAKALNGKPADAALQARATAFQQKQVNAQQELQGREQTFNRNRAYVTQQLDAKFNPIVAQVMATRGATIAIDVGATYASAGSLDVTNDVLAAINTQLPSVSTIAPAPPAAPTPPKPQGR